MTVNVTEFISGHPINHKGTVHSHSGLSGPEVACLTIKVNQLELTLHFESGPALIGYCQKHNYPVRDTRDRTGVEKYLLKARGKA